MKRLLAHLLILITITIMAIFGFGLAAGIFGAIYAAAAVVLEGVKYFCIDFLANSKSYWKNVIAGIFATALISFSGYASWSVIDKQAVLNNNQVASYQIQFQNEMETYNRNISRYDVLDKSIKNLQSSIDVQLNRVDRNNITDARIQEDRRQLETLKQELNGLKIEKPVEIKQTVIPGFIPVLISILIELSSVLVNFFVRHRNEEQPKMSVPSSVPMFEQQPKPNVPMFEQQNTILKQQLNYSSSIKATINNPLIKTQKETNVPVVEQQSNPNVPLFEQPVDGTKEQNIDAEIKPFKSVRHELNLTNAQRMKLKRCLTKDNLDWDTFVSDKNNIDKAKQYLGLE